MSRLRSLDFLRGIAVILVLFRHHWVGIYAFQNVGWIGVDLFFVLSGFLVSGLLFAEYKKFGDIRPFRFLIRRGFKIYPMFYLSLLLTWIGSFFVRFPELEGPKSEAVVWLSEAFFLQNYVTFIWGHHWSLAVEEHFYILLVLFFPLVLRYIKLAPVVFVACLVMRFFNDDAGQTHLRIDSLLMGVCVAYVYHFGDLKAFHDKYRTVLIALCAIPIIFMLVGFETLFTRTIGFSLLYISFASLLILYLYSDLPTWKPIATVGFYSYGIYLFHLYFIRFVVGDTYLRSELHHFTWWAIPSFLIYIAGALGLGIGMSYLVEKPFLAFRDKRFPRRTD